jgi:hypothetical protein
MTRTTAPGAAKEIEMTTQIRSLMFVAAVAILPVACGTSSPMGPDLAALEAGAQVSSFRSDPSPVPPQAPEPQSPESDTAPVPAPADPNEIPGEDPKDPQADPGSIELPTSRPAPPSDPNTDPTDPNTDPFPSPAPPEGNTGSDPVPPTSDPHGIPVPPSSDTVPVCVQDGNPNPACTPAPSPVPPTDPVECQVASIEIRAMGNTFAAPAGEGFIANLTDKGGLLIEDGSCEKLVWAVEGARDQSRVVIHYENDSRYVYVEGMHGTYKVGVTAPNGVATSIGFEVN